MKNKFGMKIIVCDRSLSFEIVSDIVRDRVIFTWGIFLNKNFNILKYFVK
jgi:hypothetical protein